MLYFDHTLDNHGASGAKAVRARFESIQQKYPGAQVTAGRLDDFAEIIWRVKDQLPVVTAEIGDTWIHGAASDPYKTAGLRTLIRLKTSGWPRASLIGRVMPMSSWQTIYSVLPNIRGAWM